MTKKLPPSKRSKSKQRKNRNDDTDIQIDVDSSNKESEKRRSKRIKDVNKNKTRDNNNSEPISTSNLETRKSKKKPTKKKQPKNGKMITTDDNNNQKVVDTPDVQAINVLAMYDSLPVVGAASSKKSAKKKKIVGNNNRRKLTPRLGKVKKMPTNNGRRSSVNKTTKKKNPPKTKSTLKESTEQKKVMNKMKNKKKAQPKEQVVMKELTKEEKIKSAKYIVNRRNEERLWRENVAERLKKGEYVSPEEREKHEKFQVRKKKQRELQRRRNTRIKNDPVLLEKQREKWRLARERERSEGPLHTIDIVDVDSTEKSKRKKSDKNSEERRVRKKSKYVPKKKASVKRKANARQDSNTSKKRKNDVSTKTAKGRCGVLPAVNVMNTSRRPLRRSTRLSMGVTTYKESSSDDEEMKVNNDLLPVSLDKNANNCKAKGNCATLSTVEKYYESSSGEDEDMVMSESILSVSEDEECPLQTCMLSITSTRGHTVHNTATFNLLISRVIKEEVHNTRDQDDVQLKVHTRGCKCNAMRNFFNRLNVNFEKENCEYFIHRKGSKEINNVMIVSRDNIGGLKTDDDSALMDEQELYKMILNGKRSKALKISFAQCGLKVHRNGFTCIVTADDTKVARLMEMRDKKTQSLALENKQRDLHDDYCDYIVALPCKELRDEENVDEIFTTCFSRLSCNNNTTNYGEVVVKSMEMGHHLKTCIQTDYFKSLDEKYLVLLTVTLEKIGDTPKGSSVNVKVTFNVAGGKRHLGETSIACAKRELEEETNITLDTDLYDDAEIYNDVDQAGRYYFIDVTDKSL
jgi:hypothetical protein